MSQTQLFTPGPSAQIDAAPSYLVDHKPLYRKDAHEAGLQWFRDARYGLCLHYGLYSLLGRQECVQQRELIPVAEYAKLKEQFTAAAFDAMRLVEFAIACGMRYVNLTARHHDGFCLWNTQASDFNSATAPARRDLVGELAVACEAHGLGLCLHYSHGRDWRHPHAPHNDAWGGQARPDYLPAEASYAYGAGHDLEQYLQFMKDQLHELLTAYGPIAAIWLDGIEVPLSGDRDLFHCQDLYDMIHSLQPQVLVAYEQGLLGTEDFLTTGPRLCPLASPATPARRGKPRKGVPAAPPREICVPMTPGSWGYLAEARGRHLDEEQVWARLREARAHDANLLLNSALLADGSLDPEDFEIMLRVGERLERCGWPG